jgi:hypothetical protein
MRTAIEICRYAEGSNVWKLIHLPYATGIAFSESVAFS